MTEPVVLDASAILCLLRREKGHERVRAVLEGGLVSIVNWSEIIAKLDELGATEAEIDAILGELPVRLVPFDRAMARSAGLLRRKTMPFGLSFGDRACVALALAENMIVVTTDRDWSGVPGLKAEFVR